MKHAMRRSVFASAIIAAAVVVPSILFAYVGGWLSGQRLTPQSYLRVFQEDGAHYPGLRSNHAQGICVTGTFQSSGQASRYSIAQVFQPGALTPVLGRFSIPGPNPTAPDSSVPVRGMALLLKQSDGEQWRTAMLNAPVFSVNTPRGFYDLLEAQRPDPRTGKPDKAKIVDFRRAHPDSAGFFRWAATTRPSHSYATQSYNSLDTFYLIDKAGARTAVRWRFESLNSPSALAAQDDTSPLYLSRNIARRLAQGPLGWRLLLILGARDAPTLATVAWPAQRPEIDAGTLTLTSAASQTTGACRDVNFDPTVLPRGMVVSSDPLLAARSAIYAASYLLRTSQEAKFPRARTVIWPSAQ